MADPITLPPLPHPVMNAMLGDDWADPFTADQLRARDLEIVRLVLEDARPEPDCRTCAKRSALHIRTVCALPRKQPCTNGDRYEPLPPVRLWRTAP